MNTSSAFTATPLSSLRKIACAAALAFAILALPAPAGVDLLSVESASAARATVSQREHRVASGAVQRVQREMRSEGAHRSTLEGCWADGNAVSCTGIVHGRDAAVKWRCIVLVSVRKGRTRLVARLTEAICTAEEAAGRRASASQSS